ncbi:MAG TPA: hypothetical protein VI259_08975 [Gemmatimonadaceae bacterium]
MTGAPDHHDARPASAEPSRETTRYPTNHIGAVLDSRGAATAAVKALVAGGFLDSEIRLGTGTAAADELDATTGRRGLADLLIRFAEWIGITDEEMETKNRYEQAMRENRFVLAVAAPTADRKERATQILREHAAHTISFFGQHTIEHIAPPNNLGNAAREA